MSSPQPDQTRPTPAAPRSQTACIAICCSDPALSQSYAQALRQAGFPYAREVAPQALAASQPRPGAVDLLVCDADQPPSPDQPLHWTSLLQAIQPAIGAIAVTTREDPRWIVSCIRNGALNCHLASDPHATLVAIATECVDRHENGLDNLKTLEERRRAIVSANLRKAICEETVDVHFQPIVNCDDWTCDRVEVLARWTDPTLGVVSPAEFVGAAEEEGFVSNLGQLVLRKSLRSLATLQTRQLAPQLSINVSRRQFDNPRLVQEYHATVLEHGFKPSQIIIEVTETASFENPVLALSLMQDFLDAGFQLAVDDFGTGETSFIQMSHVQYNELKIDRSLVSCIFRPSGLSIMRSVIEMAKSLNMQLVAEGVEDQQTAQLLKSLDVDYCQGYYFARPMDLQALANFLELNGSAPAQPNS